MKKHYLIIPLAWAGTAQADTEPKLTIEQAGIVYDQCLARAANQASKTDALPEAVFEMAKTACATTRVMVIAGRDSDKPLNEYLDGIDAERAIRFPLVIPKIREQRRQFEDAKRNAPNK